ESNEKNEKCIRSIMCSVQRLVSCLGLADTAQVHCSPRLRGGGCPGELGHRRPERGRYCRSRRAKFQQFHQHQCASWKARRQLPAVAVVRFRRRQSVRCCRCRLQWGRQERRRGHFSPAASPFSLVTARATWARPGFSRLERIRSILSLLTSMVTTRW